MFKSGVDVNVEENLEEPSFQGPSFAGEDRPTIRTDDVGIATESVRFRRAISQYRNERLERERLQERLNTERELSKFAKSLQLPSSMFCKRMN